MALHFTCPGRSRSRVGPTALGRGRTAGAAPAAALFVPLVIPLAVPSIAGAALANAGGGTGACGGTSYRQSRLARVICDPTPGAGSLTVMYDTSALNLNAIFNEDGYQIDKVNSFLGIQGGSTARSLSDALAAGGSVGGKEGGFVQISWTPLAGSKAGDQLYQPAYSSVTVTPETYQPDSAFTLISSSGPTNGVVPFGLDFTFPGKDPAQTYVTIFGNQTTYTVQSPGSGVPNKTAQDYLTASDGTVIAAANIKSASVFVPEPTGSAVPALAATGLLARRRRARRAAPART